MEIRANNKILEQRKFNKAEDTVIEGQRFVGQTSGLIVEANATTAKLGYIIAGAVSGETTVSVVIGNDYEVVLNGDEVFAAAHRNKAIDLVVSGTEQKADLGATSVKILEVCGDVNAGTIGSAAGIKVRIADGKALK